MTVRLFVNTALKENLRVTLDEKQSHYLAHVMRLRCGAEVLLFNGKDGEWNARICDVTKKQVALDVLNMVREQNAKSDVCLCFAPVKKDNNDLIVQKTTELGVGCLCPVITKRTITSKINLERMNLIATEACEQSERLDVPEIQPARTLDQLLSNWEKDRTLYYLSEREDVTPIKDFDKKSGFLIGPEGGFDEMEIKKLAAFKNAKAVHLGQRILRAETACITAMVLWNNWNGWQ